MIVHSRWLVLLVFFTSHPGWGAPAFTRARTDFNALTPPSTPCSISASNDPVCPTQCSTLTMTVSNPDWIDSGVLDGQPLAVSPSTSSFSKNVCTGKTAGPYVYNGSVAGPTGVATCSTTVHAVWVQPSCTMQNSGDILYNCGLPTFLTSSRLTYSNSGCSAQGGIGGNDGVTSQTVYFAGTYWGSVHNPGASNTCATTVNARCAEPPGTIVESVPNWGYRWAVGIPPYCDYYYHCNTQDCANEVGGQDAERGCINQGCVTPESKLLLADKTWKRADETKSGDLFWNPLRRRAFRLDHRVVGPEKYPLWEIGYGKTRVKVTNKHPMVTKAGMKQAEALSVGDLVLGEDLEYHRVTVKRALPLKSGQIVYNFVLSTDSKEWEDHLIVVDGIVTGDQFLQQRLESGARP